ncbi:MAG TPA: HypC/HybG/HupF family hydrogenase formation chaperone [Candidatus Hydrogenedentes bacterium]|nr:HypC/HybG/HupF family hydrogenase formation chaperone [Candidatus Hydrogenedentota bacterium]
MCLAIPARVIEIDEGRARVEVFGNTREANLALVEDVAIGDYVLVHAGFAIQKLEEEDAQETLQAFEELGKAINEDLAT